ncbi:MAG: hypothetical protein H0X25_10840 [Acidobacteriales bacterium]|nr:hypothetical protein [Terriglobales bacterium]
MNNHTGVVSAAYSLPSGLISARDALAQEGLVYSIVLDQRLGIDSVPACGDETASSLALAACQEALRRAGIDAALVDVIVDFSILPQDYLVPAWNMSNKLQHELGARKAFTVGFSGGGGSNFLVAMAAATTLIETDDKLKTALLVAGDVAIPGNRILNPADPVSILGDCASAMVLQKGAGHTVLDFALWTDGANHDVYYVPGGALANHNPGAYRIQLDKPRFDASRQAGTLGKLVAAMLEAAGLSITQIASVLLPNVSQEDQSDLQRELGLKAEQVDPAVRKSYGYLQGNDFVLNYLAALEPAPPVAGSYVLAASHGMGFMPAAVLLRLT